MFEKMEAQTSKGIPFSRINPHFLRSNATSHAWPFGAIAELIDNAYDPDVNAEKFWIDKLVVKGQDCLIFMDNGNGMDYEKLHKMLSFGFNEKHTVDDHVPIGVYGNGFKSGSMRLGKDAIVFSKKENTMCVGLLSQTYLQSTKAQNVIVPIVEFTNTGQTVDAAPGHEPCLRDILKHSLFNTKEEILKEFSIIDELGNNSSGTRIIIWNLTRCPTGELELDFIKTADDIRILDEVYSSFRERNKRQTSGAMSVPESEYSLRAYCSILYLKPRMEIILRKQKVETQSVIGTLAKARTDTYRPDRTKMAIPVTFGYNKKSKECYGLMMYHKNRLIKAYEPVACQRKQNNQRGEGVIGVIECNYLTPTHNKQNFDDTREYRNTLTNLNLKLEQYFYDNRYCYSAFKPAENTDVRNQTLQQKKKQQKSVVTPGPSDDRSAAILDTWTLSTTLKRKNRAKDISQEIPKKNAKQKCFNKETTTVKNSPFSDAKTADCKDFKKALKNDSSDAIDPSIVKEESIEITKGSFEDQQNYKVLYLQVMDAVKQLQANIEFLKKIKTEEVDTIMASQELKTQMFSNHEGLQKYFNEIKRKIEASKQNFAAASTKASIPGEKTEYLLELWTDEKQDIPESESEENKTQSVLREFRQLAQLLVSAWKLEQITNEVLKKVLDKGYFKEAQVLTKGAEFHESQSTFECEGKDNLEISTQNSHQQPTVTDAFTHELAQHSADSDAYRFLCSHAGMFHCKLTNIAFEMKQEGDVQYTVVFWENSQLHNVRHLTPAGPLYNIKCPEDSLLNLYLPHCEIHMDQQNELLVAHFSKGNVEILEPLKITSTHVILEVRSLSSFGLLKKWIFPERPISAQVLLFYRELNALQRTLFIHLLPGNIPVEEVRKKHTSNMYIQCSSLCQLIPGKKYRPLCEPHVSHPKDGVFLSFNDPNYHSTFDVNLNIVDELTLGLLDENGQEVWEPRQICFTAGRREDVPVEMNEGAAFVDNHRDTLIQSVSSVSEIADVLLTKNMVTCERYSEIINAPTEMVKMRKLYNCLDSGGRAVKAAFYKILKKKQPDIVEDLESRSSNASR